MKKVLGIVLSLVMLMGAFAGCSKNPQYTSSVYWEDVDNQSGEKQTDDQSGGEDTTSGGTASGSTTSGGTTSGGTASVDMSKKLDLSGKTITMAVTAEEPQYSTSSFKAMISAFEKKYNCKVEISKLAFDNYNQQVSQRMSTGNPFDICFLHGSFYPGGMISGIYADLTEAIKQVGDSNFDSRISSQFDYNGKKYGVSDSTCIDPYVMMYNDVLFEENGLEDPLTLYKQGKWTWDKIFEMGRQVTDSAAGTYFLDHNVSTTSMYGTPAMEYKDNKVYINLKNSTVRKGYELIQKIYVGKDAIGLPWSAWGDGDDYKDFIAGRVFMVYRESMKYNEIVARAKTSIAFGKKAENLKIVPVPLPAENTSKTYPTGWYQAVAAGQGSDPRIAVTFADFKATYKSSVKGSNEMSTEQQELVNSLRKGNVTPSFHGAYTTSSGTTLDLTVKIPEGIVAGKDITQSIDEQYAKIVAAVEATVGKGNYVAN